MRPDGKEVTQITTDDAIFIGVLVEWIYDRNESDLSKTYKIRSNGTEHTEIIKIGLLFLNIVGDWIFYMNSNYDSDNFEIYKVRIDGIEINIHHNKP